MTNCCSSGTGQGQRSDVVLDSVIECPHCGTSKTERMPVDVVAEHIAALSGRRGKIEQSAVGVKDAGAHAPKGGTTVDQRIKRTSHGQGVEKDSSLFRDPFDLGFNIARRSTNMRILRFRARSCSLRAFPA